MRDDTFSLDEFTTGEWSDRPEYASDGVGYAHVQALHEAQKGYREVYSLDARFFAFLTMQTETTFEFHLYRCFAWGLDDSPNALEPVLWVYGTTFDGVRETSGGQNFTVDLPQLAEAATWLHGLCCDLWPSFREWYGPSP